MNKKGMTLLELLVYMVLAAFLLAPVIMLMRNSSVNMARDAINVDLRMSGRDLLNIIYDDLKNTGFKLNGFKSAWSVTYFDVTATAATPDSTAAAIAAAAATPPDTFYCLDHDWSSINPTNGAGFYDGLTIRKGVLDPSGAWQGIDAISYSVVSSGGAQPVFELKRGIAGFSGSNALTLAKNVAALKFRYSEDLANWYDNIEDSLELKKAIKYIKVIIVLKDNKKLAPTASQKFVLLEGEGDAPPAVLTVNDQALYERHEMVVPVPNNGLFIEEELDTYNIRLSNPSGYPCASY